MELAAALLERFGGYRLEGVLAMRLDVAAELLAASARLAGRAAWPAATVFDPEASDRRGEAAAADWPPRTPGGRRMTGGVELLQSVLRKARGPGTRAQGPAATATAAVAESLP